MNLREVLFDPRRTEPWCDVERTANDTPGLRAWPKSVQPTPVVDAPASELPYDASLLEAHA